MDPTLRTRFLEATDAFASGTDPDWLVFVASVVDAINKHMPSLCPHGVLSVSVYHFGELPVDADKQLAAWLNFTPDDGVQVAVHKTDSWATEVVLRRVVAVEPIVVHSTSS